MAKNKVTIPVPGENQDTRRPWQVPGARTGQNRYQRMSGAFRQVLKETAKKQASVSDMTKKGARD